VSAGVTFLVLAVLVGVVAFVGLDWSTGGHPAARCPRCGRALDLPEMGLDGGLCGRCWALEPRR